MKNKYTKKNNKNKSNEQGKLQEVDMVDEILMDETYEDDDLIEEVVIEDDSIEDVNTDSDSDEDSFIDEIDILSEELDEDMASRLSLYDIEDDDDEEEDIKEFISRDYDVVAESRRRVNQPGKRKFEDGKKSKREKAEKEKKPKREKVAKEKGTDETKANFIQPLWEKWIAVYSKYTMQILYGTLGMLATILLITIIVLPKDKVNGDIKDDATSGQKLTQDSTEEESTDAQISVADLKVEAEDSEIHKLIVNFIDAEKMKCDVELAKTYLDNTTNYAISDYITTHQRYVDAYHNVKCYKFDFIDGMYYVFVSYEIKFKNIETSDIRCQEFVVKYDSEQKKYFVHNILETEKADLFIAANAPEIQALSEDVNTRHNEAIAKDDKLKTVVDLINQMFNTTEQPTAETTTPAN